MSLFEYKVMRGKHCLNRYKSVITKRKKIDRTGEHKCPLCYKQNFLQLSDDELKKLDIGEDIVITLICEGRKKHQYKIFLHKTKTGNYYYYARGIENTLTDKQEEDMYKQHGWLNPANIHVIETTEVK